MKPGKKVNAMETTRVDAKYEDQSGLLEDKYDKQDAREKGNIQKID